MIKITIKRGLLGTVCRLLWYCATLAATMPLAAEAAPPPIVPAIIQRNYDDAHSRYASNPDDMQAAWQLGRACFDRAEFSRNDAERASLANEGAAACRKVISRQTNLAAGHYYLAMNLAQLARTRLLGALPLLGHMESEWLAARALDEKIDYAGPDRFLGLLYRDAPGWPISLGNSVQARQRLLRAVELCPNFPENYLNLIESYFAWNNNSAAARAAEKLRLLLPAARKEFTGEYWAVSWTDWTARMEQTEAKLAAHPEKPPPGKK